MRRTFYYMGIAFFCCMIAVSVQAQNTDSAYSDYDTDSIASEPYQDGEELAAHFDSVTASDASGVRVREADKQRVRKMRDDDAFWYYNTAPEQKKEAQKQPKSLINYTWLPYLLWGIIIVGFIVFLIWFLLSSNVQLFKKSSRPLSREAVYDEEENIFEIDYEEKIMAAVHLKDFRLAIRLLYLQLLTQLAEKGLIDYLQQKTNNEYVLQLYGTVYYSNFFRLTRHFEYAWYGQLKVSEIRFSEIKIEFDHFQKVVKA